MRRASQASLDPTACCFTDILDIWGDGPRAKCFLNSLGSYEEKLQSAWLLPCFDSAYCCQHNQFCCYTGSSERFRVQGPPCVDWSPAGSQQGIHGEQLPTMLASGAKTRVTGSQLVGLENVRQLPGHVVQDAFGPGFEFFDAILSPDQVGFEFMSRERTFSVGLASFHFLAWLWFRSSL